MVRLLLAPVAQPVVLLNQADYQDRVYACWLGKNIGGTLGVPFEGRREPQDISFYTALKQGEPAANDDLDLQILWLKAMEEWGGRVDARILGEYWLKYVPVDWNEYGIGKANMKQGLLPPISGEYENEQWKHSNGAWIRSEIWACLAPGCPSLAARMAREDACVDHGAGEGTLAEIFTATVESAAFLERDRDTLIQFGLENIPQDCGVARAIRAAVDAKKAGKDWRAAREDVIRASEDTGWFQAPRNVAYTMIGWLYGEGDFGRSICIAVDCGDDTDCTGATLGSILGILHGTSGIPAQWKEPIGASIKTVAIGGFQPPEDIDQLTRRTVAMAHEVLAQEEAPVRIVDAASDVSKASEALSWQRERVPALWTLSPFKVLWQEDGICVEVDYGSSPLIQSGEEREVRILFTNRGEEKRKFETYVSGIPAGWSERGLASDTQRVVLFPGEKKESLASWVSNAVDETAYRMTLVLQENQKTLRIPITLMGRAHVAEHDLALASRGALASADSEYLQESPCAGKVIDGIIPDSVRFEGRRWHSSIETPHPHWIQVKMPEAVSLESLILRFADPSGFPVDFQGLALLEDGSWKEVFRQKGNKQDRSFHVDFDPVLTDTFKLIIERSANPAYPNAAQIGEIELYGRQN